MKVVYELESPSVLRARLTGDENGVMVDPEGLDGLTGLLEQADAALGCRVIVIEGDAGTFCNGMDLRHASADPDSDLSADLYRFARFLRRLRGTPRVVISAIDGQVAGAGIGIAAAADISIATEASSFGLPELVLGIMPAIVLPILFERMPPQKARSLALQSSVGSQRAFAMGLVDKVVPDGDALDRAVRGTIKHALRCRPESVAGLKLLSEQIIGVHCADALDVGADRTADLISQPDTVEAINAFLQGEQLPWFERYRSPRRKA